MALLIWFNYTPRLKYVFDEECDSLEDDAFEEGQILNFAVPLKNGKKANIKGQIVWADDEGFGVIFMNKS